MGSTLEIQFAGTVLDYGGVNSAAQARALRYQRIGNVREAGMNNLQKALGLIFKMHRFINEESDQSIDSVAGDWNYYSMKEYWSRNFYDPKTTPEQVQARIRAMLAKDREPLGSIGRNALEWWTSSDFPPPKLMNSSGRQISAENMLDLANQLFPNDPLKAIMTISNFHLKDLLNFYIYGLNGGEEKRGELLAGKKTTSGSAMSYFSAEMDYPRDILIEKAN